MKYIFLFLITTLVSCFSIIPFEQSKGVYKGTKDEFKHISPFFGIIGAYGNLLKNIRFYGNYKRVEIEPGRFKYIANKGDPTAQLILKLFPSPDGVQFIANERSNDPFGNLSRRLEEINNIIEILVSDSSIEEKKQLVEIILMSLNTKPNERELYRIILSFEEQLGNLVDDLKNADLEEITKHINSIKHLSTDLSSLTGFEDNRALESTKKIINNFSNSLSDFINSIKSGMNKKKLNTNINALKKEKKLLEVSIYKLRDMMKEIYYAHLMVDAYADQEKIIKKNRVNDPNNLYPPNIVIISLLTFFAKIADSNEDLKKLPFLMKEEFNPTIAFSKQEYLNLKRKYLGYGVFSDYINLFNKSDNIEDQFLLVHGYDYYENQVMRPVAMRGNLEYNYDGIKSQTFSDCGETTVRNILIVFMGHYGEIPALTLKGLESRINKIDDPHSRYIDMLHYFLHYKTSDKLESNKAHNDWLEVVSNLNDGQNPHNLNDVVYGRYLSLDNTTPLLNNKARIYEVIANLEETSSRQASGIVNLLNVIARLIPDTVLNEIWSPNQKERYVQIAKKLDRLCELFTTENRQWSWVTENNDKIIGSVEPTIKFLFNQLPASKLTIQKEHFSLHSLISLDHDWRNEGHVRENYPNLSPWIAVDIPGFCKVFRDFNADKPVYTDIIYNNYLSSYKRTIKTMHLILNAGLKRFYPLFRLWVDKGVFLSDQKALNELTALLYGYQGETDISILKDDPIKSLIAQWNKGKNTKKLFKKFMKKEYWKGLEKLLQAGININNIHLHLNPLFSEQYYTPLGVAVKYNNINLLKLLMNYGADVNLPIDDQGTLILIDLTKADNIEMIELLLNYKGVNVNIQDRFGNTPLYYAVYFSARDLISLLLKHGANPLIKNNEDVTPLNIAENPNIRHMLLGGG